ncbi:recombinase family protein [Micromonospora sediminicola]|uniref:recombinase family protein n=1 Tax=Micromonospora sediminicola TaxID=946078 RepID=UPI00378ACE78
MRGRATAELAATYERISDDREGRELGVDRQRKDNQAVAEREGLTLVGGAPYTDNDLSASTKAKKDRPQYRRLLADARAGRFSVIVAYTQGRLTRTPREYEDLIDLATQYGIRFLYVRSPSFDLNTAQGREIGRTMAARAAGEAEETAERVARAVTDRVERGEFHGGPRPYGLEPDAKTIREDEAERIRAWARHVLAGGSLRSIARELNEAGVSTISGAPWRGEVIRKILLNPRVAGLRVHKGAEYPSWSPEIIAPATWRALKVVLESPDRRRNPGSPARKYLGVGLFTCERCPGTTVNTSQNHNGQRTYLCKSCYRSWKAQPIDDWLVGPDGLVELLLAQEDQRARLMPRRESSVDLAALETEASAIRTNMAELATEYALARGAVRAALQQGMAAGEARLAEIEAEIVRAGQVDPLTEILGDDPVAVWRATTDLHRRQAVIRKLMTVALGPPIRGRAPWEPEKFIRVEPVEPA